MSKYDHLPIKMMESRSDGTIAIKLTEPPFDGIIFNYGKVDLNEDGDTVRLAFEYEILDMADKGLSDKKPFEVYIGKILEELIHIGIQENSITYTGGVDENRTKDSEQSDT